MADAPNRKLPMTRRRPTSRTVLAATAIILSLTIAGCASPDTNPTTETATPTTQASETASDGHNSADTAFAQMMIEHHVGAIEMADLALERATTPEVRDLATRIRAAQGPEIDQMTAWLEGKGEPTATGNMTGMDHGSMEMDGLDQAEAMTELGQTTGTDFDRRFLELMIAHHTGALDMAQTQLADGTNTEMLDLAHTIGAAQETEITEMEDLLETL